MMYLQLSTTFETQFLALKAVVLLLLLPARDLYAAIPSPVLTLRLL